jgi:coniferyl-aldehyde dehydrogenase
MTAALSAEPSRASSVSPFSPFSPVSPGDLLPLLERLRRAHRRAGFPSARDRIDRLRRLEDGLLARKDELAAAISHDFGNRSRYETFAAEIFVVLSEIRHARGHLRDWMRAQPRDVGLAFLPASAEVVIQPLGVVGVIAPWNYPVQLALAPLVGAIAAGNHVMVKPSELVPRTGEALARLIEAVFPSDVATVVCGDADVAQAFSRLPFDHLVFTGSTRVGKIVMRAAAENLVPVTLELGGKSPAIVGTSGSLRSAAARIMAGKCFNAGQTCVAPDYALVPRASVDEFIAEAQRAVARMYPTLASNPDYTSIVSDGHFARLTSYLDEATARGARVVDLNPANETLDPGTRKMAPKLLIDPPEDLTVMQEEIFGPILPIKPYDSFEQAIDYVNDRPHPLALYYLGENEDDVDRLTTETLAGGMSINETVLYVGVADLPFGGVGPSGMGHYHGVEGFETFSKKKSVFRQSAFAGTALLRPPFGRALGTVLKLLMRG